jgi:hypothetical protein
MTARDERTPPAGTEGAPRELGKRSTTEYQSPLEVALLAHSVGLSVLPPRGDGTKAPLYETIPLDCEHPDCVGERTKGKKVGWKHRQHERATASKIRRLYKYGEFSGVGLILGHISGHAEDGLQLFEFEGRAVEDGTFDDFLTLAKQTGLGTLIEEIRHGYEELTPTGGIHWLFYCPHPVTEPLARVQELDETTSKISLRPLIETKGSGGFCIIAPSGGGVHPSGLPWQLLQGGLNHIIVITQDEWEDLHALARQFDRSPRQQVRPPGKGTSNTTRSPGGLFNEKATWAGILEPHGWVYLFTASDGREHWCRPDKNPQTTSATITPDGQLLYVFTSSTRFEQNRAYPKFSAYALLNHTSANGKIDWRAATRELTGREFTPTASRGAAVTVCLSDVEPEKVKWIWRGRIPRGKLTLIPGDPEQGKSTVAFDIAARCSRGKKMPGALKPHEPMSVILMTAEDGLGDTVVPRLLAAGADLQRIHAIVARKHDDEYEAPLSFPEDIDVLREEIQRTKAELVILDTLNAFLTGRADSHRDHHVRRALHPLSMLAEETGVAILIIHHLNKSPGGVPLNRVGGSIGVIAAVRAALLVARDPEDEEQRVLAVMKSNLANKPRSLIFRLVDVPTYGAARVKWEGFSDLTPADLLAPPRKERDHEAADAAEAFLECTLAHGAVSVDEIKKQAEQELISETTLQRAKRTLGIVSKRKGFGKHGQWTWSFGETE